ncbi:hypothetical protein BDZ89DRAFT_1159683 [Hymenopellis radicata]|nr:hypothetical protein BDZ89DRAFT_1159683 [Hymenopellis radicata]
MSALANSHRRIFLMDGEELTYDKHSPLGGGRSSHVYKGDLHGKIVAVKVLPEEVQGDSLLQRVMSWKTLDNENVAKIVGMSPPNVPSLYLVYDYYLHGNVRQYLVENPNVDRRQLIFQTALGMAYLHSERGMDARNPEAWKGAVSKPSDVYAFAMSTYEIFTSTLPWGVLPEKHIYQLVVYEDSRPDRPDPILEARVGLTNDIWGIMEEAWHHEARLRPSFDIIVRLWQNLSASSNNTVYAHPHVAPLVPHRGDITSEMERMDVRGGNGKANRARSPTVSSMHSYSSGPPAYEASPPSPTLPAPTLPAPSRSSSLCAPVPTRLEAPPAVLLDGDFRSSSPGSSSLLPSVSRRSSAAVPNAPQRVASPPTSSTFSRQGSTFVASGRSSNSASSWDPSSSYARAYTPNVSSIDENGAYNPMSAPAAPGMLGRSDSSAMWEHNRRQSSAANWDRMSTVTDTPSNRSINQSMNAVLLAGALQAEVHSTRIPDVIDSALIKIQHLATNSDKDAQKLVTAGVVPTLIHLLKIRAAETTGLDIVLVTLGLVAHDPISSNTIFRTNTTHTLLEIFKASISEDISTLALWCLNRICRSTDVALGLISRTLRASSLSKALLLIPTQYRPNGVLDTRHTHSQRRHSGYTRRHARCTEIVDYLRRASSVDGPSADVCAGMYAVGRISRSIKLAKALHKAGCVPLLAFHLSSSTEPGVLLWTARAVGCLMRPNSGDMAKILLEADIAHGLARLPSVLPTDELRRVGSGTRKALVEAGVVDALLAGLRTVADEPHPQIHIEMALAVSFLGDVGGGSIRKEIVSAGGITILKRVGANGSPEVAKACSMAVTSITGNIWTRNAASAKTAMSHNWSGGCPDYHCTCPVPLMDIDTVLGSM